MTSDQQPDRIRDFIGSRIARYEKIIVHAPDRRGRLRPRTRYRQTKAGWTPIDALAWAKDRDRVSVFRDCVFLVRLCGDEKARAMPEHQAIHAALGLRECVGPAILTKTTHSLGITDERARHLVNQIDAEDRHREALAGSAER